MSHRHKYPRIRDVPEDFAVQENLRRPLLGHGAYTYIQVEKRLLTTDQVAASLARATGVPRREVGYAGRKDRFALTRQWFSLPTTASRLVEEWKHPDARIVARGFHPERLQVGQLKSNSFQLIVRNVDDEEGLEARRRLDDLIANGMPNRFGRQRFGRKGRNVKRGADVLLGKRRPTSLKTAWLRLSALQAGVFNRVLECRRLPPDRLVTGDIAIEHDTGKIFIVGDEVLEQWRLARFEVSPTGPIFGTEMLWPRGEIAELEFRTMAEFGVEGLKLTPPPGIRLYGGRRALRARLSNCHLEWRKGALFLAFDLPAGSYATVLLEELFPAGLSDRPIR